MLRLLLQLLQIENDHVLLVYTMDLEHDLSTSSMLCLSTYAAQQISRGKIEIGGDDKIFFKTRIAFYARSIVAYHKYIPQ